MLLSHFEWLCFILPTLIAATPQDSPPLPDKLQRSVPACAQPCLYRSLNEQFPLACTGASGLACLCSRYSFDGESLGEVALGCIYAFCPSDNSIDAAYNVCLGQLNAVSPTLTALSVLPPTSSSSPTMSSSRQPTSTTPSPTITSNTPSHRPSSTNSVIADSIPPSSSPTSSTSTSLQPTVQPATTADPPRTMSPAQIAGLSVAAVATFMIAIGLMALSVFLRRRRERKLAVINEKQGMSPSSRHHSARFSQYFPIDSPTSEPPKPFPKPPAPVLQTSGDRLKVPPFRNRRSVSPALTATAEQSPPKKRAANFSSVHPLFRPGAGVRNDSSKASLPISQIGLAISAELPGDSPPTEKSPPPTQNSSLKQQRRVSSESDADPSKRPDTMCTQDTVFEEDDARDHRRESRLLPMPPVPIPPIRSFQPSRKMSMRAPEPAQGPTQIRPLVQQPELFLDIPARHSRSQPIRILPTENPRQNPPPSYSQPLAKPQLAPAIQIPPTRLPPPSQRSNATSASELSGEVDIPDYYFTAWQDSKPKGLALSISPRPRQRQPDSPKPVKVKPKLSSSTLSRANSTASTNIRDSTASQTSFETADPNDSTPEDDDDDKQLDGSKLSPVAESPISNLRYPKVPRSSNVYVARSPRSPLSLNSQDSPHEASSPSSLFVKRRGEQSTLHLPSPIHTGSPLGPEARSQTRRYRQHLRTASDETWSTLRASERSTRTQSGLWPRSPAMYESDVVRPLTIRSKLQPPPPPAEDMQALKSPAWVPRLTPTRQGEDLLISVTYSKPGH